MDGQPIRFIFSRSVDGSLIYKKLHLNIYKYSYRVVLINVNSEN